MTTPHRAFIVVTGQASDADDHSVPGIYSVDIMSDAPADLFSEIALEAFHENIGIACLDDFVIMPVDQAGRPFIDQREGNDIRGQIDLLAYVAGDVDDAGDPGFEADSVGARMASEIDAMVTPAP